MIRVVLEFDYPYDEKARLISQNMLVSVNDHIYEISRTTRNMNGTDTLHVYGTPHFVYEAQKAFIPTIGDHIGKSSRVVLQSRRLRLFRISRKKSKKSVFFTL